MPLGQPAGQRSRPFTLQQGTSVTTTEGDPYLEWRDIAYIRGDINPLSTQEQLLAAQRGEEITHAVTILWRPNFPAVGTLRIVYGNGARILFVIGVTDPDEGNRTLVLRCREVVTNQVGAA